MIERLMLALCTAVVFSAPASADQIRIYGHGTKSCEKLLTEYQQNLHSPDSLEKLPFSADTVWVAGYLTAFNRYSSTHTASVLASTDIDGAMQWIVNYCAQHPGDSIAQASVALVDALLGRRR